MGLRQSAGELGAALLATISTRLELFSIELSEQKESIIKVMCLSFGALLCLALALLILTLTVALMFWHTEYRFLALLVAVLVYAVAGVIMLRIVWRTLTAGPPPFEASLAELRNDMACLKRLGDDDPAEDARRGGPDHV
ncbi:phage holin family protein [Pusillimonas sp. CC-YST705]|uniref:Phage holin family protein n=1 Tax=Mesopusillimonas faecipullorum TaxID=2755040 RepID=A0ABS8CF09_9BURK|nr:phage holin family protein [Mesopusillimonas faecipullorum]MCB5364598.1 phage holin family protein [Mesopusillimonas faecipullorum]